MEFEKLTVALVLGLAIIAQFVSATTPTIISIDDYPDPVLVENSITVETNVSYADEVFLNFTFPVTDTFQMNPAGGGIYEYEYSPQTEDDYFYSIDAINTTTGNKTSSSPQVFSAQNILFRSVYSKPFPTRKYKDTTIYANISSANPLDMVWVNFTSPITDNFEMNSVNGTYRYTFQPDRLTTYRYYVHANDSAGNTKKSSIHYIPVQVQDKAGVSVQIAPSCGVGFTYHYDPDKVVRGQDILFLQINKNIGNIYTDEISTMFVNNVTSTVFGPYSDREVTLDPGETDAFYRIWRTNNQTPLGTYFWHGITEYVSEVSRSGNYTHPWPGYNDTANCTPLSDTDGDGKNETWCLDHFSRECYKLYTNEYIVNTTSTNTRTVTNQSVNTTTYYSTFDIAGGTYNAYTFNMTKCDEYCYACMSDDEAIDQDKECAYEDEWGGGWINLNIGNFTVRELAPGGRNVTLSKTYESCTDKYTSSNCTLNEAGDLLTCEESMRCNGSLGIAEDFEVVKQITGEKKKPKLVTVREMAPFIRQSDSCDSNDTWESCRAVKIKLVVYNKGNQTVYLNSLTDKINKYCTDCEVIDTRCLSGPYNCSAGDNNSSYPVVFNPDYSLPSNDYQIFRYEVVINGTNYDNEIDSATDYFQLNAVGNYTWETSNRTALFREEADRYNPSPSKKLHLVNSSSFDYELDTNLTSDSTERDFIKGKNTTLSLTARALGPKDDWYYEFSLPNSWTVRSCSFEQGVNCSCDFDNENHTLSCNGSEAIQNSETSTINFDVESSVLSDFLLSSHAANDVEEDYVPGLFALSKPERKNVTQPQPEPEPEPEPQPQPQPVPQPVPQPSPGPIKININPLNKTIKGRQEQLKPVMFNVQNLGNTTAENITIQPFPGTNWESNPALVDSIEPGEELTRTVFVKPTWRVSPSTYAIPTKALSQDNESLDLTYFWFEVLPGKHLAKIKIVESPNEISLESDSNQTVPILVRNIGKKPLTGTKARLENVENCLESQTSQTIELGIDGEKTLPVSLNTKTGPKTCRATLIVSTDQEAYAFSRINIKVNPPAALLPGRLPIVSVVTIVFMALAFILMNIGQRSRELNILFYITVSILTVLVLYLVLGYMGYLPLLL